MFWFGSSFNSEIDLHSHMEIWFATRFSPAPSFLSLFSSCILGRKSALVKKKTHQAILGQPIPYHAHVFFEKVFFFVLKGCFGKQEGFVLGPTELLHRLHAGRGSLAPRGGGTCPLRAPAFATGVGNILRWP